MTEKPRKVLRVGILARINTMSPRDSRDRVSNLAVTQVFQTPYAVPKVEGPALPVLFSGPLVPDPAAPGVVSAAVRPDVSFSDGTPLLAAHVQASLSKVDFLRELCTVEVRGDRVAFALKTPNPRFDLALCMNYCAVTLEKAGKLFGSGPYMLAPGANLDAMRLVRNPQHRPAPAIEEIVFTIYPPDKDGHPTALLDAVAKGEVDFTDMLSRTDAGHATGVRKLFQPSSSTAILYFNTEKQALRSAEVRKAMAFALDRMSITEVSYSNALAFSATSLLPPMMGSTRDGFGHDPARAATLLSKAGARPGKLKLVTVWAPRPYLPHPQPVAERIAAQLRLIGIEVDIVTPKDSDEFYRACERGDYDLLLGGWIADTPDPADFLDAILRSDRVQMPGARGVANVNRARFRSPTMDEALKHFRENPSADHREAVLKILNEEAPLLPLMYGPTVVVTAWRVRNVEVSPLGVPSFGTFDLDG